MRRFLTFNALLTTSLLLAIILLSPALSLGLVSSDYFHKVLFTGNSPISLPNDNAIFGMFTFSSGSSEKMHAVVDLGALPWWADLNVKLTFFRPLAALTHWIDYQLWPNYPSLMHLHNLLWYLADILLVGFFLRRIYSDKSALIAGLAILMFAINGAHSVTVTWIADRNALMSTFFGVLMLFFHDKWRTQSSRVALHFSLASFVLALLSAEYGLSCIPFLIGYALFFDNGKIKEKILSALPALTITLAYLLFYFKSGYGAKHSELYLSPGDNFGEFIKAVLTRVPEMLGADFSALTLWLLPPPGGQKALLYFAYVLTFLPVIPVLIASRQARFLLTGAIGALVPVSSVAPSDRVLMFSAIGVLPLAAESLLYWRDVLQSKFVERSKKVIGYASFILLILIHLILSPLSFIPLYYIPKKIHDEVVLKPLETIQATPYLAGKKLILVNPPMLLMSMYFMPIMITNGKPLPQNMLSIASGMNPISIERINANTLRITPEKGFMPNQEDWLPHSHKAGFKVGDVFHVAEATITIESLNESNGPKTALFQFDRPLEDPTLMWMICKTPQADSKAGTYSNWTLPQIGQKVVVKTFE